MTGTRPSASGVSEVAVHLGELLPALLDARLVGHVGHRASGGEVRQDHGLLGRREQVGGLGHEVHAAEHDRLGIGPGERGVRELERIADEVGVLDHLVALVEVAEHDGAVAEGRLGGADAIVQLGVGGLAVLGRQRPLARRAGGDDVAHRGAGAVAGRPAVELPRARGQLGRAGRPGRRALRDEADGAVDGCRRARRGRVAGRGRCDGHGFVLCSAVVAGRSDAAGPAPVSKR